MKYIVILISFLFFQQNGMAQVPGYMGKRAWITADFNFAPALFNMNKNHMIIKEDFLDGYSRAKGQNPWAINYRPEINFEYLTGRDVALGLSWGSVRTGTIKELESHNPEIAGTYYDILKGNAFGVHIKKFKFDKSASIAPIGYYWKLGLLATRFNTYSSNESKKGQFSETVTNPVITLGIGKQKVLFDRLLLNTGMEFGYSFMPKDTTDDGSTTTSHPNDVSIHHVYSSMLGYYLFNLKVSCGYLAF